MFKFKCISMLHVRQHEALSRTFDLAFEDSHVLPCCSNSFGFQMYSLYTVYVCAVSPVVDGTIGVMLQQSLQGLTHFRRFSNGCLWFSLIFQADERVWKCAQDCHIAGPTLAGEDRSVPTCPNFIKLDIGQRLCRKSSWHFCLTSALKLFG